MNIFMFFSFFILSSHIMYSATDDIYIALEGTNNPLIDAVQHYDIHGLQALLCDEGNYHFINAKDPTGKTFLFHLTERNDTDEDTRPGQLRVDFWHMMEDNLQVRGALLQTDLTICDYAKNTCFSNALKQEDPCIGGFALLVKVAKSISLSVNKSERRRIKKLYEKLIPIERNLGRKKRDLLEKYYPIFMELTEVDLVNSYRVPRNNRNQKKSSNTSSHRPNKLQLRSMSYKPGEGITTNVNRDE